MEWINIIVLAVVVIGFGFFSFQKGREYERGLISIDKKDKKNNKTK